MIFTCVLAFIAVLAVKILLTTWQRSPRKDPFDAAKPTNVVITGAAQGIGLELAKLFLSSNPQNSVNLFLIDKEKDLLEKFDAQN